MKHIITIIVIAIAIIGLVIWFANNHYEKMLDPNNVYSGDLIKPVICEVCEECQVCGKITADRIISDNPAIDLPDGLIRFKYKGQEYTKEGLDEAKIIIDAK